MHYIQKHILDELRKADSQHYARLNPDEIESGHFRYHLSQLIKDGYVEQQARGVYALTAAGQHLVDKLSAQGVNPKPMPKVITYTLLRDGDDYYLQLKTKQPYKDQYNMIGGKLHEGETAGQAAAREVYEKTGARVQEPELAGVFEIIIRQNRQLLTHVIAFTFKARLPEDCRHVRKMTAKEIYACPDLAPDFLAVFEKIKDASQPVTGTIVID